MTEPDIEVQANVKIKKAISAAVQRVGRKEFSSVSGLDAVTLENVLGDGVPYIKVTIVSLACQVNKSHGDTDLTLSSISECLRGAIFKIPGSSTPPPTEPRPSRRITLEDLKPRRSETVFMDQKSIKILDLSASTISFLILFYFLGGFILGPAFGLPSCTGLAPCLGSAVGLVLGAVAGLAYVSYYFVKRV